MKSPITQNEFNEIYETLPPLPVATQKRIEAFKQRNDLDTLKNKSGKFTKKVDQTIIESARNDDMSVYKVHLNG